MVQRAKYFPLAKRFADTYRRFPGSLPHELHLLCNGAEPSALELRPFAGLPAQVHPCSNIGWDIGAFQWAAESIPCDLMVCLGSPVHFHQPGWLGRMVDSYVEFGPALFGCWAYLAPDWHVRTTCFWCPPELLRSYPFTIASTRSSRYDFEHGPHSFTRHVLSAGFPCVMVTRRGSFPFSEWKDHAPGVEDSLVLDQHINRG